MDGLKKAVLPIIMVVVSVVFLVLSLNIPKQKITDPSSGAFIPFAVSAIMLICAIFVILGERKARSSLQDSTTADGSVTDEVPSNKKLPLLYAIVVLLYVLSFAYIPFIVSSLIFLIVSFIMLKGISIKQNLIISVVTIAVIYVVFKEIFKILFP